MRVANRFRVSELIGDGVLTVNDGYRAKNSELSVTGLPFARAGDINAGFDFDEADQFPLEDIGKVGIKVSQPGDVVFTSKGSVGRFAFVRSNTQRFVYSPQLCFWRSNNPDIIEPRYLYYWMLGPEFREQYEGVKGQTDMADYVSLRDQRRMWVTLPELPVQQAIASILGALDDKIELNRRMNETLEAMARAIFQSWFVDFDPVVAKSEGRRPFGMNAETAALFPDSFQDSSLGPIPRGWGTGPILEHARLLSGGTPKTSVPEYWGGEIPWVSAADVSQCDHTLLIENGRNITKRGLEESAARLIPQYSTAIVARGATTGRMCMFGREMAMNQTCYALYAKHDTPFFLHCLAQSAIDGLVHMAYGSVFDTITTRTFEESRVIVPSLDAIRAFEGLVAPMFEALLANQLESGSLGKIRDTLLPRLLSGEIRTRDARAVTEVTV